MKHAEGFAFQDLPTYSKDELFAWVHNCSDLDRGELDATLFELGKRLDVLTTRADRLRFVLLACSKDHKQIDFGVDMLTNYSPTPDQILEQDRLKNIQLIGSRMADAGGSETLVAIPDSLTTHEAQEIALPETLQYWMAVYYLAELDAKGKSSAGSKALMTIARLTKAPSIVELADIVAELEQTHRRFLERIAYLKNKPLVKPQLVEALKLKDST